MNWYYAANGQQKGPIEQAEFDRLVQSGFIGVSTLVWREGMPAWRAFGELVATAPPVMGDSGQAAVVCSECHGSFPLDQTIRLGSGHVCAGCKPHALQKLSEGLPENELEQIRRDHIKHEASVKSVGSLYLILAVILFISSLGNLFSARTLSTGTILIVIAGVIGWVAWGVNKLQSWSRIPVGIISGLGLLGFPIATIINAYILYLVFCKKGSMVFSDDYKRVIAATPHIKYRTSIIIWIALCLVILLLGLGFFAVIFGGRR